MMWVSFLNSSTRPNIPTIRWGENEIDHVFLGHHNGSVYPHPQEVDGFAAIVDVYKLLKDMKANEHRYTPWLIECFESFVDCIGVHKKGGK